VGALRKPAEEGAGGRVESRDARCALRRQAQPSLVVRQLRRH
jgi:hypothetical protein